MRRLSSTGRLLADLIALSSVNPAFLPTGDLRSGESNVANHLKGIAETKGLETELVEVLPGRANFYARLRPQGPTHRRILLGPHLDTVGQPNLDALLQPILKSGKLIGRGACDTKGCVAAMFDALCKVAIQGRRPKETEILFIGFVDEENMQAGSRSYSRNGKKADLAIVGEPTRLEVVTAHKGDLWLQLNTRGRSAHGATPHLGQNAVLEAARIVELLETEYSASLRAQTHPLLGHATINVGRIQGGTQPNIVPRDCLIAIDRRTLPGETEFGVKREILRLLNHHGLRAKFENLRTEPSPALETNPSHPWIQLLCVEARRKRTVGVHYFCDAAPLAAGGIPSIVFGPGDIAQAHTSHEWISVASLDRGTTILERFLRNLP